jgi:hypothetical protein
VGSSKRAVTTFLAVLCLAGSAASAIGAGAADDLTSVYSGRLAKAAFSHQYRTVWNFIEPVYRNHVKQSLWQHCVAALVGQSGSIKIKRISVSGARRLPSTLPLLGKVTLVDVTLQVLYTLPGERTLQAGVLFAYWVRSKGRWYAVWLPTQYSAYKAGKCAPPSLY